MSRLIELYTTQIRVLREWRGGRWALIKRLLIVLIVYLLAMRPLRSMIATCRLLAPAYYLLNRLHDWKFVILLIITEVFQLAQICFEAL